jgi:LacI family transcriptional regulator
LRQPKKGFKVPEDISIIGLLTEFWLRADCLSLTTISQHGIEIGEVAAKLLIDRLESKEECPL